MSPALAREAAAIVRARLPDGWTPEIALVLGSGLNALADSARAAARIPYQELRGFAAPSVAGHRGELVLGEWEGRRAALFCGRLHYYEGYPMEEVALPAQTARALGARVLVLTAAAGGIRKSFRPGDLVVLSDHINFMGENPLRGPHREGEGPRFPDLTDCYSKRLGKLALSAAKKLKLRAFPGVYAAMSGPSYETPAEVRMLGKLGADIVGMSTVPEAVAARQAGLEVLAVAFVANAAAGVTGKKLSHEDVLATGKQGAANLGRLLAAVAKDL